MIFAASVLIVREPYSASDRKGQCGVVGSPSAVHVAQQGGMCYSVRFRPGTSTVCISSSYPCRWSARSGRHDYCQIVQFRKPRGEGPAGCNRAKLRPDDVCWRFDTGEKMVDTFRVRLTLEPQADEDMWPLYEAVEYETWKCLREYGMEGSFSDSVTGLSTDDKSFQRRSLPELREAYALNHAAPSTVHNFIHPGRHDISLVVLEANFPGYGTRVGVHLAGNDRMTTDRFSRDLHKRLLKSEMVARLSPKKLSIAPLTISSDDHIPIAGLIEVAGPSKVGSAAESQMQERTKSLVTSTNGVVRNEIFVVHGHDELARLQIVTTIQQLTGLVPIVLHEQRSGGKTVIEKLQEAAALAVCAVVLLTPDDFGGRADGPSHPRARQNVVFEHGYFAALLGRENVIALTKGGVELPSDLSGVVYINMDVPDWKLELAKELRGISGLTVDSNSLR